MSRLVKIRFGPILVSFIRTIIAVQLYQFVIDRDAVVTRHVIGVARPIGYDCRLAQTHRLGWTQSKTLGAMQRDETLAGIDQGSQLIAVQETIEYENVFASGQFCPQLF